MTTYRTIAITPDQDRKTEIARADAITFASASSVRAWHDVFGTLMPKVVVAMGPMTATALTEIGISDVVVATEQSLSGLVEATAQALASR